MKCLIKTFLKKLILLFKFFFLAQNSIHELRLKIGIAGFNKMVHQHTRLQKHCYFLPNFFTNVSSGIVCIRRWPAHSPDLSPPTVDSQLLIRVTSWAIRLIYTSVLVAATRVASVQVVHLNIKVASWLHSCRTKMTGDYVWIGSNLAIDLLDAE